MWPEPINRPLSDSSILNWSSAMECDVDSFRIYVELQDIETQMSDVTF